MLTSRSQEELTSYERLTAESIQNLVTIHKADTGLIHETQDTAKGIASIFSLPFEPVWYVPLMVIGALLCILVLYDSGPQLAGYDFDGFRVFLYSFDLLYAIDVLLMMGCKFFKNVSIPVIRPTMRPKVILFLELFSVLPIELLVRSENEQYSHLFFICRLNKALKIPRIFYYLNYRQSMVQTNTWLKVIMQFFLVGLCVTATYSLSYNVECFIRECNMNSTFAFQYFLSISAALTNHGLGIMHNDFIWELFCTSIGYLLFYLGFGLCIGYIINDFTRSQAHKYSFKNNIMVIQAQFKLMALQKDISDACIDFYLTFWKKRKGFNDSNTFFKLLPFPMYQQVVLDVCWIPLKHSKLFKGMEMPFLRYISTLIKQRFMLEGELIYQKNHLKHKMIYIASGVIQIISEQDGDTPIMSLSAGTCLGESSLIISYNSRNTVRCKDYCEVHILDRKDFFHAILKYPDKFRKLRYEVNARYEEAKKIFTLSKHFNAATEAEGKDYFTITWIKNTLHKLMAKDDENRSKHEYQNIYLRYEMHEHKIHSMLFSAKHLDMLVITERLELDTDSIFLKATWPFVLQPESLFLYLWEWFIVFLSCYAVCIIPFFTLMNISTPFFISVSFHVVTFLWMMDFALQMFTAVKTKDELVTSFRGIFTHRLHSIGFVCDIISCVPIQVFQSIIITEMTDQTAALLHLNRTLKVWRIFKMFNTWENRLHSNILYIGYFKYLCLIVYMSFLGGALLHASNCLIDHTCDYYGQEYSTFFPAVQIVTGIGLVSWWDKEYNFGMVYLTITNISYITVVLMYVSFSAGCILENFNLLKIQKLSMDFVSIIKTREMKKESGQRILDYIRALLLSYTSSRIVKKHAVTNDMPKHLFHVMQEAAFSRILKQVPFFYNLDDQVLLDVCTVVHETVYPPNEVIAYAGDICEDIFIVKQGICCIAHNNKRLTIGDTINIMEACLSLPNLQTVITLTHCKLLSIPYSQMKQIYAKHQTFQMEVDRTIQKCKVIVEKVYENYDMKAEYRWSPKKENTDDFYKFPGMLELNSEEEYEYYVPFDRLYFFGFSKRLLMKKTIKPDGSFIYIWECIRCVFAILSCIFFLMHTTGSCKYRDCYWAYLLWVLDVTAWIDIYVRLHVCYYDEKGILVVHPLRTAKYYLTHGFLIDFIAVYPTNVFISADTVAGAKTVIYLQLNRVLQVHRYVKLKSFLYYDCLIPYTNLFVFGYIPLVIVGVWVFASIVIGIDCDFHVTILASENYTAGVICSEDSWVTQSVFSKPIGPHLVQMYGLYLAASILTTCGIQGFEMKNMRIGLASSLMSLLAIFITTCIASNIISHYSSSSPALLAYQEAMRNLRTFMNVKHVPRMLQKQIIDYNELKWSKERGKNLSRLIRKFPYPMRQDLMYDMYGKPLVENSIFPGDCKNFFRHIILNAVHTTVIKGGSVINVNDVNKHLHILFKGIVDVYASDGTLIDCLSIGSMFGNLDGVPYTRQTVKVVAKGHVELLSVQSTMFHSILDKYPTLKQFFRQRSVMHLFFFPGKHRPNDETEEDKQIHSTGSRLQFLVFNPNSQKVRWGQNLNLHLSCFVILMLEFYQFCLDEFHAWFILIQYFSDIFFFMYIGIKYHLAYEDAMGNLVTNVEKVRHYHIKVQQQRWRLYVDFVSLVPWDLIAWVLPTSKKYEIFKYLRLNRLTRLLNILEFFEYNRKRLVINHTLNQLTFVFVWASLLIHTLACALIHLCCWVPNNMAPELKCQALVTPMDKFKTYIGYLYLTVNLFTRSAQDNYVPNTWQVSLYMVLMMITMQIATAIFFSQIFLIIYKNYFTRMKFSREVEHMNHYIEREEVSNCLVERIHIYVQRLWMRHRGVLFPKLLDIAPVYLKEAIMMSAYSIHINEHPVFNRCHEDFRRQIVAHLRDNIYFPGDYIAFQEDLNNCMFFIHKGEVVAITEDDIRKEKVFRTFKTGQVFGILQGLTFGVPYNYSYRASRLSVVLSLYYQNWKYLLEFYPASNEIIEEAIQTYKELLLIVH